VGIRQIVSRFGTKSPVTVRATTLVFGPVKRSDSKFDLRMSMRVQRESRLELNTSVFKRILHTLTSARPPTRAWEVARTVVAAPSSVVKCLWGGVRLGCCSRRVRVCVSLSGVLFSVGVCVCDLLIFLHILLKTAKFSYWTMGCYRRIGEF